ncbi:4-hydroxy-tetrahydrodipicolinate reductase [Helicobacter sp. faydin-H20]|uniref:4-hydroxy-tetrahydrodipicolinate reductase n=1 Tax=Helicobacter anatolicus TaxID=2905874 RepID=UPI001E5B969B|nr:4-hydroxy-tetrahydrodipicolinate reductase [Helicobacter anatolicus]MCE3036228.1 4-hydroxy-tetrahydrodipicolinate reductase [Helicobacter anatolicus]
MKVGVFGANGRIGRLLVEILSQHQECKLSAVFVRHKIDVALPSGCLVTNDYQEFIKACDVIIDFSLPEATQQLLNHLLISPLPLVCGTTGLQPEVLGLMEELAKKTPVLYATNMSKGIAILNAILKKVATNFKESDIEICEIHHHNKKDAPSGTALTLAETCAKSRGLDLSKVRVSGRDGNIGARTKDEIGVVSLRGGDIAGRHTVGFYADGEYLEFTHNATSRLTFAKGAVDASIWLVKQKNNLYHMQDMMQF